MSVATRMDLPGAQIAYGDEGQGWRMRSAQAFVTQETAVAELRACLAAYLEGQR